MKHKHLISILILLFISFQLQAQQAENNKIKHQKSVTIVIQTNGHCESCKKKIENGLAYEKGIKDVEYDLSTAKVKVIYNPQKTNPQNIRQTINNLGYHADELKISKDKMDSCTVPE